MRAILDNDHPLPKEGQNMEFKNSPGNTNELVNTQSAMGGAAGKTLLLYGMYQSATTIANSPQPALETITEGGGWVGAFAVGTSWAEAGGAIGGPWAPATATAGDLAGGVVGFTVGKRRGEPSSASRISG